MAGEFGWAERLAGYGAKEEVKYVVKYVTVRSLIKKCPKHVSPIVLCSALIEKHHGFKAVASRHRARICNGCNLRVAFAHDPPEVIIGLNVIGYPDAYIKMNDTKLFTSSISEKSPLFVMLLGSTKEINLFFQPYDDSATATISWDELCVTESHRTMLRRKSDVNTKQVLKYRGGMCFSSFDSCIQFENAAPSTIFEVCNRRNDKVGKPVYDVKKRIVGECARSVAHLSMLGELPEPLATVVTACAWALP